MCCATDEPKADAGYVLAYTRSRKNSRDNYHHRCEKSDFSFPKQRRLRTRREFSAVLKNGVKQATNSVAVYALSSSYREHRLGIIASKRLGKAVYRNKIKRALRECFRHESTSLPLTTSVDYVCISRSGDTSDLQRDLQQCLHTLAHKLNKKVSYGS